jgi:hypothetical protein
MGPLNLLLLLNRPCPHQNPDGYGTVKNLVLQQVDLTDEDTSNPLSQWYIVQFWIR